MKVFVGNIFKLKYGIEIVVVAARDAEEAAKTSNEQSWLHTAKPSDFLEVGTCRNRKPAILYENGLVE